MVDFATSLFQWLRRHRERLVDTALLWLSLVALGYLPSPPPVSALGQATVIFISQLLLPSGAANVGANQWTRLRHLLPSYALIAVVGGGTLYYLFSLPRSIWWFGPIWLVTAGLARLPYARYAGKLYTVLKLVVWRAPPMVGNWFVSRRGELLVGDLTLLGFFLIAAPRLCIQSAMSPVAVGLLLFVWSVGFLFIRQSGRVPLAGARSDLAEALLLASAFALSWKFSAPGSSTAAVAISSLWLAFGLWSFRSAARRLRLGGPDRFAEVLRWACLFSFTVVLFHPFLFAGRHGTNDARYYATALSDALAQFRAGIFPVFVGQGEAQFNGSIYLLRIAPGFHLFGGMVDLLTGRILGAYAIQNIGIVLAALVAVFSCYCCVAALRSTRDWINLGLSMLFICCPGVLGLAYNTDLYMTWFALPWLPVIFYLNVRMFSTGGPRLMAWLGLSAGATWWCHPPTALWSLLLTSLLQLVRIGVRPTSWRAFGPEIAAGGAAFGAVALYPVVSALLYPAVPSGEGMGGYVVPAGHIFLLLRRVFPANFLPVSELGRSLGDFQLGYGLLLLSLLSIMLGWKKIRGAGWALIGCSALLVLLLLPIPMLNTFLWQLMPGMGRAITSEWVMHRLYIFVAICLVYATAVVWPKAGQGDGPRWLLSVFLVGACFWSSREAAKFIHGSHSAVSITLDTFLNELRVENIELSRYSYEFLARPPAYYTHGATDPAMENRVLGDDLKTVVLDNYSAAVRTGETTLTTRFQIVGGGRHLELPAPLVLRPGQNYLVVFSFSEPAIANGTLIFKGRTVDRLYGLPAHGEKRSFGAGGEHQTVLPLRTMAAEGDLVRVALYPAAGIAAEDLAKTIKLDLITYEQSHLPVQVRSWLPYRATVRAAQAGWLETPRMHQADYRAVVDGKSAEVRRSDENLVAVRIPAGTSQVELRYVAPFGLRIAFYLSFSGLLAGCIGAIGLLRPSSASRQI